MIVLNLTRGNSPLRIPLRLPATPADIGAAYAKLDTICMDDRKTHVASAITGVGSLDRWLRDRPMDRPGDYAELGELAERIDRLDEQQRKTFDGALTGAAFNSVADVLRIAHSLDDYIFINGVTTEKELGRFLVDSGYKGFPESVKPYLDYAAIGIEYHAEHDGAFTADGYTLRRGSAEPMIAEQERPAVFVVHLQTSGMRNLGQEPFKLALPASYAQLQYAKDAMNIEDFEEAAVVKVEGLHKFLMENLPRSQIDVGQMNELAEELLTAMQSPEAYKILAALEMEKPATLEGTLNVVAHPESYEFVPTTCEDYGKQALLKLTGDQEVVDTVEGFLDWGEFGEQMMQEDCIVQTEYGMIRRVDAPALEQSMSDMRMQSPFL